MIFLDSASTSDAQQAYGLGMVAGITTNPALMAATGRDPVEVLTELCGLASGTVFHQLVGETTEACRDEAKRMVAISPQLGLKIPCTLGGLALCAELAAEDVVVGVTAIFGPAQVALACQAGARYVLPYVHRSTRLLGDGPALVRRMRDVIEACGAPTEILAASIKTPDEAVETLLAGAHHLTLPLALIAAMAHHDLSEAAIADFKG